MTDGESGAGGGGVRAKPPGLRVPADTVARTLAGVAAAPSVPRGGAPASVADDFAVDLEQGWSDEVSVRSMSAAAAPSRPVAAAPSRPVAAAPSRPVPSTSSRPVPSISSRLAVGPLGAATGAVGGPSTASLAAAFSLGTDTPTFPPSPTSPPSPARATWSGRPVDNDTGELIAVTEFEEVAPPAVPVPPAPPALPPPPPPLPPVAIDSTESGASRSARPAAWFETLFDDDYLRTLPHLAAGATLREAEFLVEALGLGAGKRVLDVGCGYARHAVELAAQGIQVVGLDLSLPMLTRAADAAQRRGLDLELVHGDMRGLAYEGEFDAAYCLFSTFGYFDDDTNRRVAQQIARALRPGGRLALEVLNRDAIVAELPARKWWDGVGCVVLEEVDFNYFTSRVVSRRTVAFEDGRQVSHDISIRSYSLHELGRLLHQAGFQVVEVSGDLATRGRFFGRDSRHMIVVAEKRAVHQTADSAAPGAAPR